MNELKLTKSQTGKIYSNATYDGMPLVLRGGGGLLTVRTVSSDETSLPVELTHVVREESQTRVVIEASAVLPPSDRSVQLLFTTSAQPSLATGTTRAHLPLTANGFQNHNVLVSLGSNQYVECDRHIGAPGQNHGELIAHYLEPARVRHAERTTQAPLLIPLVSWFHPNAPLRLALFAEPERAYRFNYYGLANGIHAWAAETRIASSSHPTTVKVWLTMYFGGPEVAWDAFHQFAHIDPLPEIGWLRSVRTHYFDFLSPSVVDGRRGKGFDESVPFFRDFKVGLATQHGYYPWWGDYIHPDRSRWTAMKGDSMGPAPMDLETMRHRIQATRKTGAHAAIYLHLAGFDRKSPLWNELQDAALLGEDGKPIPFPWAGPDMEGEAAFMSIASEQWRRHLLRQAAWILELLSPDAIVMDETYAGLGYDCHPERSGPMSWAMISFMKELRALTRSHGPEVALLTSDVSLAGFVLWADAEGGDHAYANLLGHPEYRRAPVRFRAALGTKPWLPCAWQFNQFWKEQEDLARTAGAGIAVANGWIEYTGLAGLSPARRAEMMAQLQDP